MNNLVFYSFTCLIFFQIFSLSIPHAYSLRHLLFVFLSFACFHLYLKKWFDDKLSFTAVIFLAASMPATFLDHLQESASILIFVFLLALWAIREYKDLFFIIHFLTGIIA